MHHQRAIINVMARSILLILFIYQPVINWYWLFIDLGRFYEIEPIVFRKYFISLMRHIITFSLKFAHLALERLRQMPQRRLAT